MRKDLVTATTSSMVLSENRASLGASYYSISPPSLITSNPIRCVTCYGQRQYLTGAVQGVVNCLGRFFWLLVSRKGDRMTVMMGRN